MTRMWLMDQYHVLSAGEKRSGCAEWLLFAPVCLGFHSSWRCQLLASLGTCLGNGIWGEEEVIYLLGATGAFYRDCPAPVRRTFCSWPEALEIPSAFWGASGNFIGDLGPTVFSAIKVPHQLAVHIL